MNLKKARRTAGFFVAARSTTRFHAMPARR